jgi:hypothetical protein
MPQQEKYAERIALQLKEENEHVTRRTTWNLTLQGFLFAAMAWAAKTSQAGADDNEKLVALANWIPVIGIVVAGATIMGVFAAYRQQHYLIQLWKIDFENYHPRPFSEGLLHILGMFTAVAIPCSMFMAWLWMILV